MNPETALSAKLERIGWAVVKMSFVALILMLVMNPVTKGRTGFDASGLETVLPARIKAAGLHQVPAGMAGAISGVAVKPGQTVAEGHLLAVIANPEIEGLVERARLRMELAAARLPGKTAASTADPQRRWLEEQHAASSRALRAAEQRVREFSLTEAEQFQARARAKADRVKALLEQNLATGREAEEAQREADSETRNLQARREAGQRLEQEWEAAQSHERMARLQLESSRQQQSSAGASGGYARLEHEEARAAYEKLASRRGALHVIAPATGTVIEVNAENGASVQEGAPLFSIASSGNLHFDVSAPAAVAQSVHAGEAVVVRVPTDPPSEVPGRVAQVLLEPDPRQQSYLIRVTIPNPAPDRLLVGLEGAVAFNH